MQNAQFNGVVSAWPLADQGAFPTVMTQCRSCYGRLADIIRDVPAVSHLPALWSPRCMSADQTPARRRTAALLDYMQAWGL